MKSREPATAFNPSDDDPSDGLSAITPPIAPGTVVGGYRVVRAVGGGGMGEVYEARDDELGRAVALKVMRPDRSADPDARERFVREARALASVADPHVAAIHHVGHHAGQPFLVMELVAGGTLESRLRTGPLPLLQMVQTAREIAAGLSAAHRAGVVHRDVKPDNVVLAAPDGRAKLIDFGLAHTARVDDDGRESVGTPLYMAPEQVMGEAVTARTDLFSFGVLLYRMATGQMPFDGVSLKEWREKLLSDQPPRPPEEHNPSLPPPLADLILRLLERRPDDRPESARAVEWELAQIVQWVANQSGVITYATPTPTPSDTKTDSPSPRRRPLWPITVLGVVGVIAIVAVVIALRPPAELAGGTATTAPPPPTTPPPPPNSQPAPTVPVRTAPTTAPTPKPPPKPILLYNGKNLAGWHGVNGKTDHWAPKGDTLVGTLKPGGDQFLIADGEFGEFELEFEFRWPEKAFHTSVWVLVAEEEGKVTGLEVNLNRGPDEAKDPTDRKWLENWRYAAGGVHLLDGPSKPAQNMATGKWNKVKVRHADGALRVEWNGHETFNEQLTKYKAKEKSLPAVSRTRGAIALRTHGGPVIEYQKLVVQVLK